jgi:O-antigen/teichoic acid export membrane protein
MRQPAGDRHDRPNAGFVAGLRAHLSDPLFRHAYALIVNTGLTTGLGFVYWVAAARLLPRQEVGVAAALISSIVFVSGLAQLNLRATLTRFIPVAGRQTQALARASYVSAAVVAAVIAVIYVLGADFWSRGGPVAALPADPVLAAVFVASTVVWTIFAIQDGILVGLRATGWLTLENAAFSVAKIALLVAFAVAPMPGSGRILASWVVPMLGAIVFVNLLLWKHLVPVHVARRPAADAVVRPGRIVRFAAGDYVGSLFALSYASLLPVIVIDKIGATAGASFYVAWVIASSLQLVPPQMISSLTVQAAPDPASFAVHARRMIVAMFRILVPGVVAIVLGAPLILTLFGPSYRDATALLQLLAVAIVPYSVNVLYLALARSRVRAKRIVAVQVALAATILPSTFVLSGTFGLNGVGLGFLLGQTVVAAFVSVTSLVPLLSSASNPSSGRLTPRDAVPD